MLCIPLGMSLQPGGAVFIVLMGESQDDFPLLLEESKGEKRVSIN